MHILGMSSGRGEKFGADLDEIKERRKQIWK
jgi:hypothetical protein